MSRFALTAIMLLFAASVAGAQEAGQQIGVVPAPVALPQVCPRPNAPYAPVPVGLITSPHAAKIAELRQKETDVAELQKEVSKLRTETGAAQQIIVRVQVMEVSFTKMEKLGFDVPGVSSGFANMPAADAKQLVRTLTVNNVGRMVSEPTVVALDGQPASIHIGSDVPCPALGGAKGNVELKPIGTELKVTPEVLGDNRLRVDLNVRMSDTDPGNSVDIGGSHFPAFNVKQVCTKIETSIGDSVILSGPQETRIESIKRNKFGSGSKVEEVQNRIGTIFIVTPEIVDRVARAEALPDQSKPYTPK